MMPTQLLHALAVVLLPSLARALDNGVGLTPAMGYNTWDDFRCGGINASNLYKVADAMVKNGLPAYGYKYVSLDDCWAKSRDAATGVIQPDPVAFPDGMKKVVDYVHSKGLLFGIYTDRGEKTCVGRPGSAGYETLDAQTYAAWGVDYVKEDSCNATGDHNASFSQYGLMRDALNATGRQIYFDLCGWSSWYAPVGSTLGNAWRVGYDVNNWAGVLNNAISVDKNLAQFAGPGGFNDIDALIGTSVDTAVHLTQTQSRTQFNLWVMLSAQLIIGGSILNLNTFDLQTYTNKPMIAINQDVLGKQAILQMQHTQKSTNANDPSIQQIWLKQLSGGRYAVAFVNTTNSSTPPPPARRRSWSFSAAARVNDADDADDVGDADASAQLALAPCNSSDPAQQWNVSAADPSTGDVTLSTLADTGGTVYKPTQAHCLEVNACNYNPGGQIDSHYACKKLPAKGSTDKCAANMAWKLGKGGALSAAFSPSLCLEVMGGGSLSTCDGSKAQSWTRKGQQLESGTGFGCLSNGAPGGDAPTVLSFNVERLGWKTATFTDMWSGKAVTADSINSEVSRGDGVSQVFLLTKKS